MRKLQQSLYALERETSADSSRGYTSLYALERATSADLPRASGKMAENIRSLYALERETSADELQR